MKKDGRGKSAGSMAHYFQKGHRSRNAVGRPKLLLEIKTAIDELGNEVNPKSPDGLTYIECAVRTMWHKAANEGSVRAFEELMNRRYGKPAQAISLGGALEVLSREQTAQNILDALKSLNMPIENGASDPKPN